MDSECLISFLFVSWRLILGESSGHAAFLDPDVNRMLKKVLNEWGKFLQVRLSYLSRSLLPWMSN